MRKTLVVAAREYLAAVRTKTFLIGLLIMPIMMGGSILLQVLLKDVVDTADQHYAVVDRTAERRYVKAIQKKVEDHNKKAIFDAHGQQVRPRFVLKEVEPSGGSAQDIA